MKAVNAFIRSFEALQRSVKIKISVNFLSSCGIETGRVNFQTDQWFTGPWINLCLPILWHVQNLNAYNLDLLSGYTRLLYLFIYLMSFTKIVTNGEDSVLLFCSLFNLDILLRKLWNFDDIFDIFSMLRFSQISGFL